MRSIPPPNSFIGACDGTQIRDSRVFDTHTAPICRDEEEFNRYLLSALFDEIPPALYDALAMRLRKSGRDHRVVLSHCDLAPRNIIINEDGKIAALVDWAEAEWYPEHWEYVKFYQRNDARTDFRHYAADIFPQVYPDELVDYIALLKYQYP
jgi:hypothetical protein